LKNLKELILSRNQLTTLPEEIGKCKNLNSLNLEATQISEKEKREIKKCCQIVK